MKSTQGFFWKVTLLLGMILAVVAGYITLSQPPAGKGKAEFKVDPARLRQDVEQLAGPLAKRNYAHPAVLAQAADYIEKRFRGSGAQVEIDAYSVEGATYRNVIARFGPATGKPVVIGAHYDAEESTPGADDNASGVAGLLALADHFGHSPPQVPVELVAYSLEEPPFFRTEAMGSRRHAKSLKAAGRVPRLVAVLEMIGYFSDQPDSQRYPLAPLGWIYPDKGNFVAVAGDFSSHREVRLVKAAMREAATIPVEAIIGPAFLPGMDFSDHASYWQEGMPAVMITDTAFYRNAHYHEAGDLPETLDYQRMAAVIRALGQVVKNLEAQTPA